MFQVLALLAISTPVHASQMPPQPACHIVAKVKGVTTTPLPARINIQVLKVPGTALGKTQNTACSKMRGKDLPDVLVDGKVPQTGDLIECQIQFSGDEFGSGYRILDWKRKDPG